MKAYQNYLKGFSAKTTGPRPTAAEFAAAERFGRPGNKVTLALAMYLRAGGATQAQVINAVGGQQLNKMRGLISRKLVKREAVPADGAGHTVYKISLTAKADKVAAPQADKPARKPRKAKAKVTPQAETPAAATEADAPAAE